MQKYEVIIIVVGFILLIAMVKFAISEARSLGNET